MFLNRVKLICQLAVLYLFDNWDGGFDDFCHYINSLLTVNCFCFRVFKKSSINGKVIQFFKFYYNLYKMYCVQCVLLCITCIVFLFIK